MNLDISRPEAARQGEQAIAILREGAYTAPSGRRVEIAGDVRRAVAETCEMRPWDEVGGQEDASRAPIGILVVNGTSLACARKLAEDGHVPLVLNFASAKHPGGGFRSGARAQEESLARSSALFACLDGREMYRHHQAQHDPMYTSWMIHSPRVPVFREDLSGELLEEPYQVTFLTAPAPNAGVVLERDPERKSEVERVMRERVARVLAVCAAFGHRRLVLGAWGCGVFDNDPRIVADAFATELEGRFAGRFDRAVFAVLDRSREREKIGPFEARLLR
jgi:uncharacterized protein (TIGR02452 family)